MTRWHHALSLLPAALLPVALVPAAAWAGPALPVSIEDRGDHVAIILAGAHTSATHPGSYSDRIELPLDQAPPAVEIRLDDATVRKVELRAQPPSVRVQLRHSAESTKLAAEMAEVRQHGDTIEIVLPRDPREVARALRTSAAPAAVGHAAPLPAASRPVLPPPAAAELATSARPPAHATVPVAPFADAASALPLAPGPAQALATAPAPTHAAPLDFDRPPVASGSPLGTTLTFGAVAGAVAIAWLWLRRRRTTRSLTSPLEILAQVSVGPRARVVWLLAGRREMLISVSEKDVRVLGQWHSDGARGVEPAAGPGAAPSSSEDAGEAPVHLPSARLRTNPSLSGLLRLRDKNASIENGHSDGTGASAGNDTDEEPDSEWARQLVAATRRGAHR
jgi:hypothetical protein